jgi:hypothetical protein
MESTDSKYLSGFPGQRSYLGALFLVCGLASGCAGSPVHTSSLSPYQLSQIDNYTLCKGATPREAYYPAPAVLSEVRRRGLNCASIYTYSGTGQLDAAAAALGAMSQRGQQPGVAPGGRAQGVAFLRSQRVSGMNKICVYDRMGSEYVITIGATDLCPLSQ